LTSLLAGEMGIVGWRRARAGCHYETLMAMKRPAGRNKNLQDIQALKKLDPYR
jgi:hypothetical protein